MCVCVCVCVYQFVASINAHHTKKNQIHNS